MKETPLHVQIVVSSVSYDCPECGETTSYQTDGLPPKNQCHKCLKKIKFVPVYHGQGIK